MRFRKSARQHACAPRLVLPSTPMAGPFVVWFIILADTGCGTRAVAVVVYVYTHKLEPTVE